MTYPEAIQYLESFVNYEKIASWLYKESLKLERFKNFLSVIGNPQDALRCIHIAGSKGKGSTCAFIAYILRQAGYKTGLYTSPHLSDFRERIRILFLRPSSRDRRPERDFEGMISKDNLAQLVGRLRPVIDAYNKRSLFGPLSFFEVYTALAFVYFKERKADLVVLETGLGGRLDATNTVESLIAVLTPISYEHTQQLGNTLREIAQEKAGIIKDRNIVVISAPQQKEAFIVIKDRCREVGAKLFTVGEDIIYQKTKGKFGRKVTNQTFNIFGLFDKYANLKISLIGEHQLVNATTAIGAVEALSHYSIKASADSICKGLCHTLWPGRCEVIAREPWIVLDGAQNAASVRALKKTVAKNFKYKRLTLILGISKDKDIRGMCKELIGFADEIVLTQAKNPRAIAPQILARYFKGRDVRIAGDVKEAGEFSKSLSGKQDLILITGSLFIVAEARRCFWHEK